MRSLFLIFWAAGIIFAVVRPGVGLALSLAAGRHQIPSRSDPITYAGPVLLAAAMMGLLLRHHSVPILRVQGWLASILVLGCVSTLVRSVFDWKVLSDPYVVEKVSLLLLYVIPLMLLVGVVSRSRARQDFLSLLVLIPIGLGALATLGIEASESVSSGRAAALGGGPIVLAQLVSIAILVLALVSPGDLWPVLRRRWLRRMAVVFLFAVLVGTRSRFPAIALLLSLSFVPGRSQQGAALFARQAPARWSSRFKQRMIVLILTATAGTVYLMSAGASRFLLLLNPSAEVARSRGEVLAAGVDLTGNSGPFGSGIGSFSFDPARAEVGDYPHNFILESLSELGWVMGAALLLLMGRTLVGGIRRSRAADFVFPILGVYAFLVAQTSGDLINSRYALVFVVLAAHQRLKMKGSEEARRPNIGAVT